MSGGCNNAECNASSTAAASAAGKNTATHARPLCGPWMLMTDLMMAFEPRWNAGVVVDAAKMLHAPTLQVIAIHPRPLCGPWTLFGPPDLIRGI